jgi:hypothetical protein
LARHRAYGEAFACGNPALPPGGGISPTAGHPIARLARRQLHRIVDEKSLCVDDEFARHHRRVYHPGTFGDVIQGKTQSLSFTT